MERRGERTNDRGPASIGRCGGDVVDAATALILFRLRVEADKVFLRVTGHLQPRDTAMGGKSVHILTVFPNCSKVLRKLLMTK